jgi:hypothetical protein
MVCQSKIAANVDGLLPGWDFITSSPGLKPNKIADDEVNNKCLIEIRLPDMKPN